MKLFFTTTWTNVQRMEGVASVTYDSTTLYDDNVNYDGQVLPTWTNETKS